MFAGITFQKGIVFELFEQGTVLRNFFLLISFLRLQFVQVLFQPPGFDQVILIEYRNQQHKDHNRDHPQTLIFQYFLHKRFHPVEFFVKIRILSLEIPAQTVKMVDRTMSLTQPIGLST